MATKRMPHQKGHIPYPDELFPQSTDEPPSITVDDIAHTVERLEAGREAGEYTSMRSSDLEVLWRIPSGRWDDVRQNPSLLWQLVTPTVHA